MLRGRSCIGYAPAVQLHQIVHLSRYPLENQKPNRSRTITKCFSFYKKRIYDFTNMFCVKILFSILWLQVFDLFWFKRMVETCTFTDFFTFLRKCIPPIIFWRNLEMRHRSFHECWLLMLIIPIFTS